MDRNKKTEAYPRVKVTHSEFQEVTEIITVLDIPFSQLAREAVREKVAALKATHPKLIEHFRQIELSK